MEGTETIIFNQSKKEISQPSDFDDLKKKIIDAFNIEEEKINNIVIKTTTDEIIANDEDFENNIYDAYPKLIITMINQDLNPPAPVHNVDAINNFETNNLIKDINNKIDTNKNNLSNLDKEIKNLNNEFLKQKKISNKFLSNIYTEIKNVNNNNDNKTNDSTILDLIKESYNNLLNQLKNENKKSDEINNIKNQLNDLKNQLTDEFINLNENLNQNNLNDKFNEMLIEIKQSKNKIFEIENKLINQEKKFENQLNEQKNFYEEKLKEQKSLFEKINEQQNELKQILINIQNNQENNKLIFQKQKEKENENEKEDQKEENEEEEEEDKIKTKIKKIPKKKEDSKKNYQKPKKYEEEKEIDDDEDEDEKEVDIKEKPQIIQKKSKVKFLTNENPLNLELNSNDINNGYSMKIKLKNEGNIIFNNRYHIDLNKSNSLIEIENNYLTKVVKPQETIEIEIKLIFILKDSLENNFSLCFKLVDDKNKSVSGSTLECNFHINKDEEDNNYNNSSDDDKNNFGNENHNKSDEEFNDSKTKKKNSYKKKNSSSNSDDNERFNNDNHNEDDDDDEDNKNIDFNGKINEDDFENLYNSLNDEYNIEVMGKNKDFIKIHINKILKEKDTSNINNKNELIDFIKEKLLDYLF